MSYAARLTSVRQMPLYRSSFALMLTTGLNGILGFSELLFDFLERSIRETRRHMTLALRTNPEPLGCWRTGHGRPPTM